MKLLSRIRVFLCVYIVDWSFRKSILFFIFAMENKKEWNKLIWANTIKTEQQLYFSARDFIFFFNRRHLIYTSAFAIINAQLQHETWKNNKRVDSLNYNMNGLRMFIFSKYTKQHHIIEEISWIVAFVVIQLNKKERFESNKRKTKIPNENQLR